MATLPPEKVRRLARQMMDRLAKIRQDDRSEDGYYDAAAKVACVMADYPPAVIYLYFMLTLDQVIKGHIAVTDLTRTEGEGAE